MLHRAQPNRTKPNRDSVSDRRVGKRQAYQSTATACPRCGSHYINRSATRWWERPFRWLTPLVPFRCRAC